MRYTKLNPLPNSSYYGVSIYPEDKSEERFLNEKIDNMKGLGEIRKFIQRK